MAKQVEMIDRNATNLRLSWQELRQEIRNSWRQGEHFTIIAPTYGGKSVLAVKGLLPLWKYTLTLDAKGEDKTLRQSGRTIRRHPTWLHRQRDDRFHLLLPHDMEQAASLALSSLRNVFTEKGWLVNIDELRLFTDRQYLPKFQKALPSMVEKIWLYGRSRGITLLSGTQAPRFIPSAALEQARHFLIGRTTRKDALDRLGEISFGDIDLIRQIVPTLDDYEFLYLNSRGMGIGKYPL
jgi:hypothetical protein